MADEKQRQLYANLMEELKTRIEIIPNALNGSTRLPAPLVREFCWLQLRMLCELIALSCLVAHGDISYLQPHKVGRSYSADDILDRLTKLRPHFFPEAITTERKPGGPDGTGFIEAAAVRPAPMTKQDLIDLYAKTHRHLHRGSLKRLLTRDVNASLDMQVNAPEIASWADKLNRLMSNHVISIKVGRVLVCGLRNRDDNFRVQVAVAEAGDFQDRQPEA